MTALPIRITNPWDHLPEEAVSGRLPSAPGSHPSDRTSCGVSAVPVSIPDVVPGFDAERCARLAAMALGDDEEEPVDPWDELTTRERATMSPHRLWERGVDL